MLATRLHHDDDVATVVELVNTPTGLWEPVSEALNFWAEVTHDSRRFVVVSSPVRYFGTGIVNSPCAPASKTASSPSKEEFGGKVRRAGQDRRRGRPRPSLLAGWALRCEDDPEGPLFTQS